MVAAIFEARLTAEQVKQLGELMREGRESRPKGVVAAMLTVEGELARLTAVWKDRDTLDRYLAVTRVPRGTELMRAVGAEPSVRIAEVPEFG